MAEEGVVENDIDEDAIDDTVELSKRWHASRSCCSTRYQLRTLSNAL
jgi:hypothetical protein